MDLQAYKDEILTSLGGDEIDVAFDLKDETLTKILHKSFREVQRYLNITKLKTIPYLDCITMDNGRSTAATVNTGDECLSVIEVYRTNASTNGQTGVGSIPDAMYMAMTTRSGEGVGMANDLVAGYSNMMQWRQIVNTISTDLRFEYDTQTGKLYINAPNPRPSMITIRYVPRFKDIAEIRDPYWEDIILRLALANSKVTLGRIRGRYSLSNPLWAQDAETLLTEGNQEIAELRTQLREDADLAPPVG